MYLERLIRHQKWIIYNSFFIFLLIYLFQPRDNEGGGKYGRGTITRLYTENSQFKVKIELTANHMGYFEFRLCPQNNPLVPASQACLNRHLLQQVDGSGSRFYPGEGNKVFDVELELPPGLTCTQCVLQWRYVAANNWGKFYVNDWSLMGSNDPCISSPLIRSQTMIIF